MNGATADCKNCFFAEGRRSGSSDSFIRQVIKIDASSDDAVTMHRHRSNQDDVAGRIDCYSGISVLLEERSVRSSTKETDQREECVLTLPVFSTRRGLIDAPIIALISKWKRRYTEVDRQIYR